MRLAPLAATQSPSALRQSEVTVLVLSVSTHRPVNGASGENTRTFGFTVRFFLIVEPCALPSQPLAEFLAPVAFAPSADMLAPFAPSLFALSPFVPSPFVPSGAGMLAPLLPSDGAVLVPFTPSAATFPLFIPSAAALVLSGPCAVVLALSALADPLGEPDRATFGEFSVSVGGSGSFAKTFALNVPTIHIRAAIEDI